MGRAAAQAAQKNHRANKIAASGIVPPSDLKPYIGPSGSVSDVLNRKRKLSLRMIRRLHDGLKIPYESLMNETAA